MKSTAESPDAYIEQLPEERQEAIKNLRQIFQDFLPQGFKEQMSYGMLGYVVPHSIYPNGYHCNPKLPLPFINVASQKNFIALYHMGIYANNELFQWFVKEYPKHSQYKLDMGKSCIRFKRINDIPYKLIEQLATKMTVNEWINVYESATKKSK